MSTYCKGKRTLDMLLFRIKLLNCLFSLFKYSTLLWILSPRCYIPSLGHVVIQAAWTQQAGVLFLTPLQTQCFGPAQPTGRRGRKQRAWWRPGWGLLGLEQSNVSQISHSSNSWSPLKVVLDTCSRLLLPGVLPPCLQPLPCPWWLWSSSNREGGSRWRPW